MISLISEIIAYFAFATATIQFYLNKDNFTDWIFLMLCAIMTLLVAIRYEKDEPKE